jgi:transcriptional regulator with XRE-family HTH domain
MPKSIHRPEHQVVCAVLRDVRLNAGLTQEVLAKKLKRPQTFVSTVERGLVRQDFLQLRDWCTKCGSTVADMATEFEVRLAAKKKSTRGAKRGAGEPVSTEVVAGRGRSKARTKTNT